MTTSVIYLDNNATTQCAPEVVDAMCPFFAGNFGNASSPHFLGREAARAVAVARERIADSVGCDASDVLFTSGATESNNLVIFSAAQMSTGRRKIVTSAIEHKSVLGPCEALETKGFDVVRLPVQKDGQLDLGTVQRAVDSETVLVSIQGANNEIGVLQPVKAVADIAHAAGAAFHCDAAQLLGKIPVSIDNLGADFVSFSSHKAYGPKGLGFLVIHNHVRDVVVSPLMFGGGQENGFRPGTLNVPGIVGTGVACHLLTERIETEMLEIDRLRGQLEDGIRTIASDARIVGSESPRLPGTLSVMFPGVPAELLIARTPTVCMSMGSACTSGTVSPSHVLLALGMTRDDARCVIRLSLGRYNTDDDVQGALRAISATLRDISTGEMPVRE
ncbi:MAG: cysteine desulfurase family protein [Kiritimatiellae bacterium]|nr:cysteine desulfurase family protein [Kiritimatiellia bacterium]